MPAKAGTAAKPERPKVVLINRVSRAANGASALCLVDLARYLAACGWQVTVIADDGPPPAVPSQLADRLTMVGRRGAKPSPQRQRPVPSALSYLASLLRLLRRGFSLPRQDVVVTMTDPPFLGLVGLLLAKRFGAASIQWSQDLYPHLLAINGGRALSFLAPFLVRLTRGWSARHDFVVAISRSMIERLKADGVPPHRLRYLPNWRHADIECQPASAVSALRDRLGLRDHFTVLYGGTLGLCHPMQGWLDAAARLQQSGAKIAFIVVGGGRCRARLDAEVAARRLRNVHLLSWQPSDQLSDLLAAGDLHLCAVNARADGLLLPLKFNLALASGRPVLFLGPRPMMDADGFALGDAVLFADPEDGNAIADRIDSLARNSDRWKAACAAAAQAAPQFDRDRLMQQFTALIGSALPIAHAQAPLPGPVTAEALS